MTLLPIVDRELRVAARRPATYWLRLIIGGVVFALWFLLVMYGPAAVRLGKGGHTVFAIVATIAFAFALLSGPLLTADSLSLERREGTLGLLFLTELRGYDVVLGKLIGTSVHAFYGMAAIVPLLSYSILIGGVTPGESFRIGFALLATIFFSLSAGMLISAHSRDAHQAMGATLSLVIVLPGVFAGLGLVFGALVKSYFGYFLSWWSPIYLFSYAFDPLFQTRHGAMHYGASLLFVLGAGTLMLTLAARHLSQAWHEKGEQAAATNSEGSRAVKGFFGPAFTTVRGDVLCADPYLWLASRDFRLKQKLRIFLGAFFAIWLCLVLAALIPNAGGVPAITSLKTVCFQAALLFTFVLHQGLKWMTAFEASRRFSEDRHSGAMELLLVTPVSIEEIIAAQERALKKFFFAPAWLAVGANEILLFLIVAINPTALSTPEVVFLAEVLFGGAILMLVDFRALSWVGMWMALQTRRHTRAIQATLLRVMLLPWVAIFVLVLLTIGGAGLSPSTTNGLCLFWVGLAGVVSHAFASRAKEGLLEAFRGISAAPDASEANPPLLAGPLPAPAAPAAHA